MLELPEDIVYLVLAHLDTARDLRALSLTNKRLHTIIHGDNGEGWRVFVRTRFPSLRISSLPGPSYTWSQLADSLTWQSRAWDRRSLSFQAMMPASPRVVRRGRVTGRALRQAPFHPVVDAQYDLAAKEELVVWGAGENIVARRRKGRRADWTPGETLWHRQEGAESGYRAGYDDVTDLSIVEDACGKPGELAMVVGRDNGDLALLRATEEGFGQRLADLNPRYGEDMGWAQDKISSLDVLHSQGRVAVATKSAVLLYTLPEEESPDPGLNIAPSAYLNFDTQPSEDSLGAAKWLGKDTLVLGMNGRNDPLRYVKVTPTGFEDDVIPVRNTALLESFSLDPNKSSLCASSLTPIDATSITGGHGTNLLLSSWRDGTIRLQDLRTPTLLDLVYSDNINPWSALDSLLPFGASHFVGGGADGATIKVFDFRWPRQYFHTTALACGNDLPVPDPSQRFAPCPPETRRRDLSQCDHLAGRLCRWHALSRDLYHRPNGTFFFSKTLPTRTRDSTTSVWSMARPRSNPPGLAPNFYIGLSGLGGVVEANLSTLADANAQHEMEVDPNLGWVPYVQRDMGTSGYECLELDASLMETGDGRMSVDNLRNVRLPVMRGKGASRVIGLGGGQHEDDNVPDRLASRHRLDERYHVLTDFGRGRTVGIGWEWFDDETRG